MRTLTPIKLLIAAALLTACAIAKPDAAPAQPATVPPTSQTAAGGYIDAQ